MSSIVGVSTNRVSEQFIRDRLLHQIQYNQRELFRVQTQLSTGYLFQSPGEAPIAASRVIRLQRLLERKAQVQINLATTQSYLGATDVALGRIADLLAEARATALGAMGTVVTGEQRAAAALQIQEILRQLTDAGNQNFRGRYLFAGANTRVLPFKEVAGGFIEYRGDLGSLQTYVDTDLLAITNIHGHDVFGGISSQVVSTVDLDPVLTPETRLADLRGGRGIRLGSILISDGDPSHHRIIDLSSAETIGDVAALINAHPPLTRHIHVEITPRGLKIELESDPTVNLSIREVGEGTTARELGILTEQGVGNNPIIGEDLDPIVRRTTRLADVLGSRARAALWIPGDDNDLIIEADRRGESLNGVTIRFVADPTVTAGNEVVLYNEVGRQIEVRIEAYRTQAQHVVAAINAAHEAGVLPFTARLDFLDNRQGGLGLIPVTPAGEVAGITAWGGGIELDQASGLQIRNGTDVSTVDLAEAETVEDLLNILNAEELGLLARINEAGTGLEVRTRRSGADFAIGENGGLTATQLGLRTFTRETRLSELNFGEGVTDYQGVGGYATAIFRSDGNDNDLALRARQPGAQWNGYVVKFVDSGGPPGSESVSFDADARRVTFYIVPGVTTAKDLVRLFEITPGARDYFTLELAGGDFASEGLGTVRLGSTITEGGFFPGAEFRIIRADGVMFEVDISGAQTIGDVLDRINNHPANLASGIPVQARLARYGNGIELVDAGGPQRLTVQCSPGQLAGVQLGLVPRGQSESTSLQPGARAEALVPFPGDHNNLLFRAQVAGSFANGIQLIFEDTGGGPGSEFVEYNAAGRILRFGIVPGTTTANQILALLQADPLASAMFSAELVSEDGMPNLGTGTVSEYATTFSGGEPQILTGEDVAPTETQGLFTALLRLKTGLTGNDLALIRRAIELLDLYSLQLNYVRAELGARQQSLDVLKTRLDAEEIDLRAVLAEEYEVDLAEVVSALVARQMALEASLRASAEIYGLTLLHFL